VGVLEGAMVEVKAIYVDAYSGLGHPGAPAGCLRGIGPDKKNARHTARRGQASIVLAGTL
jgi:hypothetical protein